MGSIVRNPETGKLEVDSRIKVNDLLCVYRERNHSLLIVRGSVSEKWQTMKYSSGWEVEQIYKTLKSELLTYGEKAMLNAFKYYQSKVLH